MKEKYIQDLFILSKAEFITFNTISWFQKKAVTGRNKNSEEWKKRVQAEKDCKPCALMK